MGKDKIKRLTHDGNPKKSHKDNKENQSLSRRINKEKNAVKKKYSKRVGDKITFTADFNRRADMLTKLICKDPNYQPMKIKDLTILLDVAKEDREELENVLNYLLSIGKIGITSHGKYVKPDFIALEGVFEPTASGFGFVMVDGLSDDIFVAERDTLSAFYHDRVMLVVTKKGENGRRSEGKITKILGHEVRSLTGVFKRPFKGKCYVIPDSKKIGAYIYIDENMSKISPNSLVDGARVSVDIKTYGDTRTNPTGSVEEVIGHINDPQSDVLAVVKAMDLPYEFNEEVKEELKNIPDQVDPSDYAKRLDLRDQILITIDGDDTKDVDDAVSLTFDGINYTLGVHIADVSHYVKKGSALDKEAYLRGNSVYMLDSVIPMLDHKLSNGICSLNEGVDRLALSCIMTIDQTGNILSTRIEESLIKVRHHMTYKQVQKLLDKSDDGLAIEYEDVCPMIMEMAKLAAILRSKRFKNGSIDFDLPETCISLDEHGFPIDIRPYERHESNKIIEDFMLAANQAVAQYFYWLEIPFVYRCHEDPDNEKMYSLKRFVESFGINLKIKDKVHPKEIQKLINTCEDSDAGALISRITLRSLKKAYYGPDCLGHFGLAFKYYCHFTSPIRRYADLSIHRIIKDYLHGKVNDKYKEKLASGLDEVCKHISQTERQAINAEREVNKIKMAEYMEKHIGEEFEGFVSGLNNYCIFVELKSTIEGAIRLSSLKGYYDYDDVHYQVVNYRNNDTIRIGQPMKVRVVKVDKILRTIDFERV